LLQTESTQVGAALDSKAMSDMPLGGQRGFAFLARLSPSVVPGETGSREAAGGGFSANGVRAVGQTNYLLNGVDNNNNEIDFMSQTAYIVGPSVEAISEMTVQTNGYNAEYGRAAGAVVNVNIKSGTNQVHGSLFEMLQNRDLNANSWGNNLVGFPRNKLEQNQFGVTAGAPIVKNRLFIFGDYQGTLTSGSGANGEGAGYISGGSFTAGLGYSGLATIPTAAMKKGDFSSILGAVGTGTDSLGNPIAFQKGAIYDPLSTTGTAKAPLSRMPFPGNIIPLSRMDLPFYNIMQLFPSTNQRIVTGTQPANDYFYNTTGTAGTHQGDARVDYRLSDKDILFGSVSWSNTSKAQVPPFPGGLDASGQFGTDEFDLARNAQLSYSRVWSPSILTESRVSFTRMAAQRTTGTLSGQDLFKQFHIGGFDPTYQGPYNGGLPALNPTGYAIFGTGSWMPTIEYNNDWDLIQNLAITKGTHAFKMGAEFRQIKFPFLQVPEPRGQLNYLPAETAFPSNKASSLGASVASLTGDGLASALLGQVDNSVISTLNFIASERLAWAGYLQDDWKFSQKLTINLGLRYELWSPIGETFGDQTNFDLQTMTLYIPAGRNQNLPLPSNISTLFPNVKVSRGQVDKYLIPWDKFDFGPRIGLAYRLMNKTVIRAGYGIFYGGEENQGASPNRGESIPFNTVPLFVRTQGTSTFVGVSDPTCPGCFYMPGGLTGGFPANPYNGTNAAVSLRGIQTDFRNSMVHKWNFMVQRELPWDMALEVGYLGNHQAHQLTSGNTDTYANIGTTNSAITSATQQEIQPACPPPTCASVGTNLSIVTSNGWGNYAAGTAKLEKRSSHGLSFLTSYTWSHALANGRSLLTGSSGFAFPDQTNWASGYSSAAWDIRHSFTSGFNYEIPFGKGKVWGGNMSRAADMVAGGWHMNGILSLRTGVPYSLSGVSCQGVWSKCEPDIAPGYVANQAPAGGRNPNQWFDINAYKVAAPLTGGNLGLQAMTGPPTRTLDFSIFKDFNVTERWKLQFRGEAFNIANTPVLAIPDANLADAKALGGNGNFGRITSSGFGTERHMQFALRLSF
jgi:hypothetical protein